MTDFSGRPESSNHSSGDALVVVPDRVDQLTQVEGRFWVRFTSGTPQDTLCREVGTWELLTVMPMAPWKRHERK